MSARELPGTVAKGAAKKVAKKAAKKVTKKAAKKTAKSPGHDARRAYEHLHRLRSLRSLLEPAAFESLQTLTQYAQAAFAGDQPKTAADLLRAGEHLAFASLSSDNGEASPQLQQALQDEYEHLVDRGAAHWEQQDPAPVRALKRIYSSMRSEAKMAWKSKAYHKALEYARGADALAHAATAKLVLDAGGDKHSLSLAPEI